MRGNGPLSFLLNTVAYLYSQSPINNIVPLSYRSSGENKPVIETNYGFLRGTYDVSRNGRRFYEFLGIPYAKDPIGDLRFEPPEPPDKWEDIRDASNYGPRCLQQDYITRAVIGDESCLLLNIFTHKIYAREDLAENKTKLLPVIVFIHGGLFMSGSSNIYRPIYFMDHDIVMVTINYRLASFGFLNTGKEIRGNMGLKDQNLALKFVQSEIKFFGGDPDRVTLVGQSAGSASVHYHIISPMSRGLFHRAISQSGTVLSPWAFVENPNEQSRLLAKQLDCPIEDAKEMVHCLKSTSANKIARAHRGYFRVALDIPEAVYGPTIEIVNDTNTFLSDNPRVLISNGQISNPVPWINGVNSEEGLIYLLGVIRNETRRAALNNDWSKYAPTLFNYKNHPDADNISEQIRQYYLGNSDISMNTLGQAADIFSDRGFFLDSHESILFHSKYANVYPYYYSYEGSFGMATILLSRSNLPLIPKNIDFAVGSTLNWFTSTVLGRQISRKNYGVCHNDELYQFFYIPLYTREIEYGDDDYEFSKALVELWVDFAISKNDTDIYFGEIKWEPIKNTSKSVRRLRLDRLPEIIDEPFEDRLKFWRALNLDK